MPQTKQQTLCGGNHSPTLWCTYCTAICLETNSCKEDCPLYNEDNDCGMCLELNNRTIE